MRPRYQLSRFHAVIAMAIWLALGAILYAPSTSRPFDVVDFPQFLPYLRASQSPWEEFTGIARFYASEGRMSLLAYAFLVVRWKLLGDWVLGWQLLRAFEMGVIAIALYTWLRRQELSRLGAVLAASFFLCSHLAATAWMRLNMSEPVGALLLIIALSLATAPWDDDSRFGRNAVYVRLALVAMAMLLMKEMFVGFFVPILFVFATHDRHGAPRRFAIDDRLIRATATLSVVALLMLIPVAYVALSSPAGAYARAFGSSSSPINNIAYAMLSITFPFPPFFAGSSPIVPAAAILVVLCLTVGVKLYVDTASDRTQARNLAILGYLLPLTCALLYSPWPRFSALYGIPYIVGPAILTACAATGIQRAFGKHSVAFIVVPLTVLTVMGAATVAYARQIDSQLRLSKAVVVELSRRPPTDTASIAVCGLDAREWERVGFALARFGRAIGYTSPPLVDVQCNEATQIIEDAKRDQGAVIIGPSRATSALGEEHALVSLRSITFPGLRPSREEISAAFAWPKR